jgi:hypothetical protein
MKLFQRPEGLIHQHYLRLTEHDAVTLPRQARALRVLKGSAWVSIGRHDLVINPQQTLHLQPTWASAVITALGHQPVEIEWIA